MALLNVKKLNKSFQSGASNLHVIKDLDLDVERGDLIALTGTSGSGKSTLLNLIGSMDIPDSGSIKILGIDIVGKDESELTEFRLKHIGFIFQFHYLLPEFTAQENIAIPSMIAGNTRRDAMKRALELLDFLKLDHRKKHYPSELSGGEKQRIAIARALINKPDLVLADEPTGNLDAKTGEMVLELFKSINKEFKQSFILATHNEHIANSVGKKYNLESGHLI